MTPYYLLTEEIFLQINNYQSGGQMISITWSDAGAVLAVASAQIVIDIVKDCPIVYQDEEGNWFNIPVSEVSTWRLRAVLALQNMEDSVTNAIDQLPEPDRTVAIRAWDYGSVTDRNSQIVAFLQHKLQLTNEQLDQLFSDANNIQT